MVCSGLCAGEFPLRSHCTRPALADSTKGPLCAMYVHCNANDYSVDHFDNLWCEVRQFSTEHWRDVSHKCVWAGNLFTFSARLTRFTSVTNLL